MTKETTTSIQVSGPQRDASSLGKLSTGDVVLEGVLKTVETLPAVGGGLSAIFGLAIQKPSEKRTRNFLAQVDSDLRAVEDKLGCLPDELYESGSYSSALISATHIALLTQEPEKIEALRAAMLNIALTSSDDEAFNQMRIAALRDMTSIHIRVLDFFAGRNPQVVKQLGAANRAIQPSDFKDPLQTKFRPDLPFYIVERACRELESAGLIAVPEGYAKSLGGTNFATMLATPFGLVVHGFITRPTDEATND